MAFDPANYEGQDRLAHIEKYVKAHDVTLSAGLSNGASASLTGATAATRYVGGTTSGAPASGSFLVGDFVVDQSGQVWVCVTAGSPGTWTCATKPRPQMLLGAQGLLAESQSLEGTPTAGAPTSQKVSGALVGLRAGDVVTGIALRNLALTAGTAPTTARFGLADATGKILVLSGNLNSAATWAAGFPAFPFTAPYTVLADGAYYACYVVNGSWGTTQPSIPFSNSFGVAFGSNPARAFTWTGQTDLPAVGSSMTITGAGPASYMAVY